MVNKMKGISFEQLTEGFSDPVAVKMQWEGRTIDPVLQRLVDLVNRVDFRIGITLSIGSGLISGKLISINAYFEKFATDMASGFENPQQMRDSFLAWKPRTPENDEERPVQFIHLEDARTYDGEESPVPALGSLWRGKITSVDGFILGELEQS